MAPCDRLSWLAPAGLPAHRPQRPAPAPSAYPPGRGTGNPGSLATDRERLGRGRPVRRIACETDVIAPRRGDVERRPAGCGDPDSGGFGPSAACEPEEIERLAADRPGRREDGADRPPGVRDVERRGDAEPPLGRRAGVAHVVEG